LFFCASAWSPFVTAALDNTIFYLAFQAGAGVLRAQIAGRLLAVVFNYAMVRSAVFHSHREHRVALPSYLALVAASGAASYFLISWMSHNLAFRDAGKTICEAGLFLLNFLVQRDLIFTRRKNPSAATDWNAYYRSTPFTARLTRRYTGSVLVKTMKRYAPGAGGCLVELGGANSCFLERITQEVAPRTYHVIDSNQYGLELLSRRVVKNSRLVLHRGDVRERPPDIRADLVFSVGLIEHFDPEDTARAVDTHFEMVKPGGCVILSFPTPTLLYRAARLLTEAAGLWKFHDERPLQRDEVAASVSRHAEILHERILWPLVFTQRLVVAKKWSSQPATGAATPDPKPESQSEQRSPWLARLFLCLGIPMGLTYALVMPPNQVPDEWAHFMRTWDISKGKLVSTLIVDVPPGFAPVWQRFTPALDIIQPRRLPIREGEWLSVLHSSGGSVYTGPVLANYGGNLYSFIPYLPAAITVAAARAFGAPMLAIYYAARFTNLALYLALIWLALRRTPRFHLLFFVLALMPMSLHQAASASADAASISLTFLFIAVVLDLAYGSRPQPLGVRGLCLPRGSGRGPFLGQVQSGSGPTPSPDRSRSIHFAQKHAFYWWWAACY
jgi:putative flippase GtrA